MIEKFAFFGQDKLVQALLSEINNCFYRDCVPLVVFYRECDIEVIRKVYVEVCSWSDTVKGIVFGTLNVESKSDKIKRIVFVNLDGKHWNSFERGCSLLFSTSTATSEQVRRAASRSTKLKVFEGV